MKLWNWRINISPEFKANKKRYMPIEIRELVIKATIGEPAEKEKERDTASASGLNREQIIADCVGQVMDILRAQKER